MRYALAEAKGGQIDAVPTPKRIAARKPGQRKDRCQGIYHHPFGS